MLSCVQQVACDICTTDVIEIESVCACSQAGVDYFLPPVPEFDAEDERCLAEAIRTDEEDAGKETVFAANLKKALRLIRQSKTKSATTASIARSMGSREDGFKDIRRGDGGDDAGAIVFGSNKDWWSDQRWVAHYCRVSPATMIRQLRESPNGWFEHWMSLTERERKYITKLTAIEVCTHRICLLMSCFVVDCMPVHADVRCD